MEKCHLRFRGEPGRADAVTVAACPDAAGKGTLVVMNDEIHTGRDVTKTSTLKLETLQSPYGPLGFVVEGEPRFYRLPARPHTTATEFDIDTIHDLPDVQVVYAHANMSRAAYDAPKSCRDRGAV